MIATAACKIFFHSFAVLGKTISVSSKLGEKIFFPFSVDGVGGFFFWDGYFQKFIYCV